MRISAAFVDLERPAGVGPKDQGMLSLPDDILLGIITCVEVRDILALRMTCKRLSAVTYLRWVWSDALDRHVVARRLPVPAPLADPAASSREALEARAVHAARFHANWSSDRPKPTRTLVFDTSIALPPPSFKERTPSDGADAQTPVDPSTSGGDPGSAVSQVLFLPGRAGSLLATVLAERHVVIWEVPLGGSAAYPVARWSVPHAHGRLELLANDDTTSEGTLVALTFVESFPVGTIGVFTLQLNRFHGTLTPLQKDYIPQARAAPLWHVSGDRVLLCDPPIVYDWAQRATYDPFSGLSLDFAERGALLAASFAGTHLVLVQEDGLTVVGLPRASPLPHPALTPLALAAGGPAVLAYHSPLPGPRAHPPLHVVPRDDAPWTHAVVLVPRMYDREGAGLARWARPEPVVVLARHEEMGVREPYCVIGRTDIFPVMHHADASGPGEAASASGTVRRWDTRVGDQLLVSPSAGTLVLGASGKGLWVETRNVRDDRDAADAGAGRARTYTARCIVGFTAVVPPPVPYASPSPSPSSPSSSSPSSSSSSSPARARAHPYASGASAAGRKHKARLSGAGLDGVVRVGAGEVYRRRCAVGEIVNRRYRLSAVALEDAVGRVVVGSAEGRVEVLEFA